MKNVKDLAEEVAETRAHVFEKCLEAISTVEHFLDRAKRDIADAKKSSNPTEVQRLVHGTFNHLLNGTNNAMHTLNVATRYTSAFERDLALIELLEKISPTK